MKNEILILKINDKEHEDLYADIISIEAEEDEKLAGVFNLRLAIRLQKNGEWTWIDDERLNPWTPVSISAGFMDNVVDVFTGYITQVKSYFGVDLSQCYLDIKGMDSSVLMSTEEKIKAWINNKDSDVASQIFNEYGFNSEVEDTQVVHDEAISTIIQRESDIQFLRRLAKRNGFECFVRNNTGYFRPSQLNGKPQKVLAMQFGTESNLASFSIELDALNRTEVTMHQLDLLSKEQREVVIDSALQKTLGKNSSSEIASANKYPSKMFVKHSMANSQPMMQAMSQGLYDESEWLIQGEGEIVGTFYKDVLRARELVTIKGVGKAYSGVYYVTKVKHVFTESGYTQSFQVKRNAVNPDGTEDFSGNGLSGGSI